VLSTAPPYTVHLVARHIKRKYDIPWVADFRDPWLENYAYNTVPRLGVVKRINAFLERSVLSESDRVVCAGSRQLEIQSSKVSRGQRGKFSVIRNGYDMDAVPAAVGENPLFHISYFGSMYRQRYPQKIVDALNGAMELSPALRKDLRLRFVGQMDDDVKACLQESLAGDNLEILDFLPHSEVQDMMYQSQVLLLTINRVARWDLIVPAKLYEYLPTGNPILGVGPPRGETADILRETGAGSCFDYEDWRRMRDFVADQYGLWKEKRLNTGTRKLPAFERKALTGELAALMNGLLQS